MTSTNTKGAIPVYEGKGENPGIEARIADMRK